MNAPSAVDLTLTVNELMARHPETVAVFNQFGMDTCCGSGVVITDAAHRDGVNLEQLLEALAAAMVVA